MTIIKNSDLTTVPAESLSSISRDLLHELPAAFGVLVESAGSQALSQA